MGLWWETTRVWTFDTRLRVVFDEGSAAVERQHGDA
jgi:hypothetical protein